MNLSAEQYLNLVDQMTTLRIQNQKFQRDNSILTTQIEKQRDKLSQLAMLQNQTNLQVSRGYRNKYQRTMQQKNKLSMNKVGKTAQDYVDQFKNSISSMQKNICQYITMSSSQQAKFLKEQIVKIKEQIKSLSGGDGVRLGQDNNKLTEKQKQQVNLQLTSNTLKCNNKQKNINKCQNQDKNKQNQVQLQQFYKKLKFIYLLWNKQKKQPTLDQLYAWVHKINIQSENTINSPITDTHTNIVPKQQFNPIQAVKKARNQSKLQQMLSQANKCQKISEIDKKQKKRKIKEDSSHKNLVQKTDRKQVQNYIKQYVKVAQKRQSIKQKQKNKKINEPEDDQQVSVLKPKNKMEQSKRKQENTKIKKNQQSSGLKKKSILFQKQMAAKALLQKSKLQMKQNVGQSKKKIPKSQSKKKLNTNESKKQLFIQNNNFKKQRKESKINQSIKDLRNTKSLSPKLQKNTSSVDKPKTKLASKKKIQESSRQIQKKITKNIKKKQKVTSPVAKPLKNEKISQSKSKIPTNFESKQLNKPLSTKTKQQKNSKSQDNKHKSSSKIKSSTKQIISKENNKSKTDKLKLDNHLNQLIKSKSKNKQQATRPSTAIKKKQSHKKI